MKHFFAPLFRRREPSVPKECSEADYYSSAWLWKCLSWSAAACLLLVLLMCLVSVNVEGMTWERQLTQAYEQCQNQHRPSSPPLRHLLEEYDAWQQQPGWSLLIAWEGFPSSHLVANNRAQNRLSFGPPAEAEMWARSRQACTP